MFLEKKGENYLKILNIIIILSIVAFMFNQLVTANQIYIFSLIPIIASILHINLNKIRAYYFFILLIFLVLSFVTTKYHHRYNVDRKFLDLENIDKSKAINAEIISKKMKHLKWITPYDNPQKELTLLKNAVEHLRKDGRQKILITHYQFISTVLNEDLNLLNRWYLWGNDTHPTETHKHFFFYKKMINKNIKENNIQVIYLLGQKKEILFKHVKNYFTEKCFKSKTLVRNRFSSHEIVDCKELK
jgi:energy-coupling factor transporter transmembrane protein EcfT